MKEKDKEPQPLLLTTEQAAIFLSMSESHVRVLVGRGDIPSVRIGKLRRVRMSDLERWVEDLEMQGQPTVLELAPLRR